MCIWDGILGYPSLLVRNFLIKINIKKIKMASLGRFFDESSDDGGGAGGNNFRMAENLLSEFAEHVSS